MSKSCYCRFSMSARESLVVGILFAVLFLATVDNQLLIPLLPVLSADLEVSIESLGRLFSVYALAAAFFNLFLGSWADRLGRLLFLRVGLFAFCLLAAATYASETYGQLLAFRAATGLVAGALSTCTVSLVADFFAYPRRGRVMGLVLSSYFAALIVGIPLSAWIGERWAWQAVFLASSALAALLGIFALFFFPTGARRPEDPAGSLRAAFGLLRRRQLRAALTVSFVVSGGTLAFLTYISDHLDKTFALTPVEISWLFLSVGCASMLGAPLSGWLSDRWTKRAVFLLANTTLVVPLLVLDRAAWGAPLAACFFAIGLATAFRQTALQTAQTELVEAACRASFLGLRNGFSQLGISFAVFVAGRLYSAGGYRWVMWFSAGLTLVGSLFFYWGIAEPRKGGGESVMRSY